MSNELINHNCRRCELSSYVKTVFLQGLGDPDTAALAIFVDAPMWTDDRAARPFVSDGGQLLLNLLGRMSLPIESGKVYLDYILKCGAGKKMPKQKCDRLKCIEACSFYRFATLQNMPNLKRIVGMGKITLEAMTGASEMGEFVEESWTPREIELRQYTPHVWMTYSPAYGIEKPAEIPSIYRVLFKAAEEAGLDPKPNLSYPHFNWDEI